MNRFQRWLKGGLWIHHKDDGWVRGYWAPYSIAFGNSKQYISDERGHHYHRTLCTITAIEDNPQWPSLVSRWTPAIMLRLGWAALGAVTAAIFLSIR